MLSKLKLAQSVSPRAEPLALKSTHILSQRGVLSLAFICFILSWTFLPALIRHELPPDLIEAYIWSHPMTWGNDKNPWLPAALVKIGIFLGGETGIGVYFIQCLCVTVGLYSTYRLTTKLTNAYYGFIATTSMLACSAYSIELQIFNDNYILMGLLPLAVLFFYRAIFEARPQDWIYAGVILGFAVMGKYHAGLIGVALMGFILTNRAYRHLLFTWPPYIALTIFLIILLPNLFWLYQHDFITLSYAFSERAKIQEAHGLHKVINNIDFLGANALSLLPVFFLMLCSMTRRKSISLCSQLSATQNIETPLAGHEQKTHPDQLNFLAWMAFAPLSILFLLGVLFGLELHREWGTGLLGLMSAYGLSRFQPKISKYTYRRYIAVLFLGLILYPSGFIYISLKNDTGNFPAQELAKLSDQIWYQAQQQPLHFVAGDRYTVGYIGLHSKYKPIVWMEWNTKASSYINLPTLRCQGALFVIESGHTHSHFYKGNDFPDFVKKQFPQLKILPPVSLSWYRSNKSHTPLQIIFGILPPDANFCEKSITKQHR